MKILISTLLLTIAVFLHFAELNAMEPERGLSTGGRRKPGRPLGRLANQNQNRVADPNDGPADRTVYYEDIEIKVWLDGRSRVLKVIYPDNYIPQGPYYKHHIFLIRTMEQGDVRLVAYIHQDAGLIGVRPREATGQKYNLEPTETLWYINHRSTHFKLAVRNTAVFGISLMPENVHVVGEHSFEVVNVAGIRFKVFRGGPFAKITGAELDIS